MGYKEWANPHIVNRNSDVTYTIKNAQSIWGKFYKDGDQNTEIEASEINGTTIKPKGDFNIYSCGRENTWSGTEAMFEIHDGNTKVVTLYYTCPHSGSNVVAPRDVDGGYMVQISPINASSGALGRFDVVVFKMP